MKVLVAIDHSPSSDTVLEAAVNRAWPAGTKFCVLNVVNVLRFERLHTLIEDATREGEQLVQAGAKRICDAGNEAFPRTSPGNPRSDISCFAKEWGADLILVGSHGHGTIGRFLLGSVAQAVLRTAPCSVEIVRTPAKATPSARKVLFATDGSDCSVAAAHAIAAQCWPSGTLFKVMSVEELMVAGNQMEASSLSAVYPASLLDELIEAAQARARSALQMAKDILQRARLTVDDRGALPVGEPRSIILDTAKDWGADLIVLGSHGRRGLDHFLLGSVSEAVAIHAPCSVCVVRDRQHLQRSQS